MLKRSSKSDFANSYVFPGGVASQSDSDSALARYTGGLTADAAAEMLNLHEGALAYWVTAIRECFEESGILLARGPDGGYVDPVAPANTQRYAEYRQALAAGTMSMLELCRREELTLACAGMYYVSFWTTPEVRARRYSTRFFVAAVPGRQTGASDSRETVDSCWMSPTAILTPGSRKTMGITTPTAANLRLLEGQASVAQLLGLIAAQDVDRIAEVTPKRVIEADGERWELQRRYPDSSRPLRVMRIVVGRYEQLSSAIGRLTAPNAGMMTGPGTNTYFVGDATACAVIDPGPLDPEHGAQIVRVAPGPIEAILVTHTHRDHSPGATLLSQLTGARLFGIPAPSTPENDSSFAADVVLGDGDTVAVAGLELRAVHTPGHASNHLCYLLTSERVLFTGDHIMQGSTVVIAPPDGNMSHYIASLRKLKDLAIDTIAPGHGELIDAPDALVDWTIAHRLEREGKVLAALKALAPCSIDTLIPEVYGDVDQRLHPIARYSLWAHLEKLRDDGVASLEGPVWAVRSAASETT